MKMENNLSLSFIEIRSLFRGALLVFTGRVPYEQWTKTLVVYTNQLYRDYNKPSQGSLSTNQDSMEKNKGFFRGS